MFAREPASLRMPSSSLGSTYPISTQSFGVRDGKLVVLGAYK